MKSVRFSLPDGPQRGSGSRATLSLPGSRRGNKQHQAPKRKRKAPHENDKDDVIRTRDVSDSGEEEENIHQHRHHHHNTDTSTRFAERTTADSEIHPSGSNMSEQNSDSSLTELSDSEVAGLDPQTRPRSVATSQVSTMVDPDYDLYTAALTTSSDIHTGEEWLTNVPDNSESGSMAATIAATDALATLVANAENDEDEDQDATELADDGERTLLNGDNFITPPPSSPQISGSGDTTISILSQGDEPSRPATPLLPPPWGRDSAPSSPAEADQDAAAAAATQIPVPALNGNTTNGLHGQNFSFLSDHSACVPQDEHERVLGENNQLRARAAQAQDDADFLQECCVEWARRESDLLVEIAALRARISEME